MRYGNYHDDYLRSRKFWQRRRSSALSPVAGYPPILQTLYNNGTIDLARATALRSYIYQYNLTSTGLTDQGDNGEDLIAVGSPTIDSNGATLNGVDQYLYNDNLASIFSGSDRKWAMFAAFTPQDVNGGVLLSAGNSGNGTPKWNVYLNPPNKNLRLRKTDDSAGSVDLFMPGYDTKQSVMGFVVDGTTADGYYNELKIEEDTAFNVGAMTVNQFTIGSNRLISTSFYINCIVQKFILVDMNTVELTDAEAQAIQDYLVSEYSASDLNRFNLTVFHKLNEANGNRLDSIGSNHLIQGGTVGYDATFQGALFDGDAGDTLSLATTGAVETEQHDDFTIVGEFKMGTGTNGVSNDIVIKWGAPGNRTFAVVRGLVNTMYFFVSDNGTSPSNVESVEAITEGGSAKFRAWHDGVADKICIQIDKNTPAEIAHSTGIYKGTADYMIAGRDDGVNGFVLDGAAKNAGFYKRVLSDAEWEDMVDNGFPFS